MKYSMKLLMLTMGIVVVCGGIVSFVIFRINARALEAEIVDRLQDRAFHAMDKIDRLLFERQADMKVMTEDPVLNSRDSTPDRITERLKDYQNAFEVYASLSFFDMDRVRIADTAGTMVGQRHPLNEYWPDILAGRDFSMVVTWSESLRKPIFYFASPVRDDRGRRFGVVVSRMPVDVLTEIVAAAGGLEDGSRTVEKREPASLEVELLSREGLILYSNYNTSGILKETSADWAIVKNLMGKGESIGIGRHMHLGEEELTVAVREQGHRSFKGNGWFLTMCIPTEVVYVPAFQLRNNLIVLLFGLSPFILGIVFLFSRTMSVPLTRLKDAAAEIGRGNLDISVPVTSSDETGQLALAFNRMAGDLRGSQDRLRRAADEWQRTFDSMSDAVSIHDRDMNIAKVNRATCGLLNVEKPMGRKCYELFHNSEAPIENCPMTRMMKSGSPEFSEFFDQYLGRWLSVSCFPILDEEGVVKGSVHVARDITERRRADEALRQKEALYRSLVDTTGTGYVVIDKEGNVIDANEEYVRLSGHRELGEILGRSVLKWTAEYEKDRNANAVVQCAREGFIRNFEVDYIDSLGKVTPIEINATVVDKDGVVQILTLCRDITDRKKAEEKIRRLNEELEQKVTERTRQLLDAQEELVRKEKLATLGQLAGSVGHELRNPLGVMNNAVYFLKTVMSDADETVSEYLGIIKSEIDTSERIISDLLDFSRTKTPQPKFVAAGELIRQSLSKCAIPDHVALQVDLPDTLPIVRADSLQIVQVFQNLITNAVQAMPDGGTLRISARRVVRDSGLGISGEGQIPKPQSPTPGGDLLEVSLSDTGEGISPEHMRRLFQPLFTTKAKGIGLGLVVCRKLVEANGGTITVESRLGEGTTFTVLLPAKEG